MATADDVSSVVVGVFGDRPVFLRDVASIVDGPEEPADYVMYGERGTNGVDPAVTIAVSKRKGTNAIEIADKVLAKVASLKGASIPNNIRVTETRNYGETAAEKSNELLLHMLIAIASDSELNMLALGIV